MRNVAAFLAAFGVVMGTAAGAFALTQNRVQASPGSAAPLLPPGPPTERQFTVTMVMFGGEENEVHRWTPGTLVARVGDPITLRVLNADVDCAKYPHGFALTAFGIDVPAIQAGEEKTFTFTPDKPGVFEFKCSNKDCGKDHDRQTGQLLVLP